MPLTKDVLDALLAVCGNDTCGQRDAVMPNLGYEAIRRSAELCNFRFENIEVLHNGKVGIRLVFSKTDQVGRGKLIRISAELHTLLQRWQERVGEGGYILRGVNLRPHR